MLQSSVNTLLLPPNSQDDGESDYKHRPLIGLGATFFVTTLMRKAFVNKKHGFRAETEFLIDFLRDCFYTSQVL